VQQRRQPEDQQQKSGEAARELHAAKEQRGGGVVNCGIGDVFSPRGRSTARGGFGPPITFSRRLHDLPGISWGE
jgi:hypothetical protein